MESRKGISKMPPKVNKPEITVQMLTDIGHADTPREAFSIIDDMLINGGSERQSADFLFSFDGLKFDIHVTKEN